MRTGYFKKRTRRLAIEEAAVKAGKGVPGTKVGRCPPSSSG
jgi:hypothetical protein